MPSSDVNTQIDEFVSATKKLTGQEIRERLPWNTSVNADAIRHFAWGIGDDNPLWVDPDYAARGPYGRLAAPPAFLTSVLYPILHGAPVQAPLISLIGEVDFHWFAPVLDGDRLEATAKQAKVFDRQDSSGRRFVYITAKTTYRNQANVIVGEATGVMVRMSRSDSEPILDRQVHRYNEGEVARIQEALGGQRRTGNQTHSRGTKAPGTQLPPYVWGPLTIGDLVCWQAAIGPSYRAGVLGHVDGLHASHVMEKNPVTGWPVKYSQQHEDFLLASQRGMPGPFDNGVMRFACLTPMLTNWMGDAGFLKRLSVRILAPNLYGDTTWFEGTVTNRVQQADGDLVTVKISGTNQLGSLTTTAVADVFLSDQKLNVFVDQDLLRNVAQSTPDPTRQVPDFVSVAEMVETWADQTPTKVALICKDQELSYSQFNSQANRLAHYLRSRGITPNTLVGLFLDRSMEMVVASLAVLKAGGIYLPLDPNYPEDRLAVMVRDSKASFVLTTSRVKHRLPIEPDLLTCLDELAPELTRCCHENPQNDPASDRGAYVMYTSGSTRQPKGVLVPNASLSRYVRALNNVMKIAAQDVYLHTASFSFSASVRQMWLPLSVGATLVITTSEERQDPGLLQSLMGRKNVTVWDTVPTFWRAFLDFLLTRYSQDQTSLAILKLRLLCVTGEPLYWNVPRLWETLFPGKMKVMNLYSQTETAGTVCMYQLPSKAEEEKGMVPLGNPLEYAQVYLLDERLQQVDNGTPGEICVGGGRLASGYLHDSQLTRERFIPNPFSDDPLARLYRTGDLARYRSDGNLEFVGRLDRRMKIKGFRIEPEEVEQTLKSHPQIHEAVVVSREDSQGHERLVGYVVSTQDAQLSGSEVKKYILPNRVAIAHLHKHETDYSYQAVFEHRTYLKHGITLEDGDCVFDVGANIGLFALFVTFLCPHSRIFCFEPNPLAFQALQANAAFYNPGIKLFPCGVSSGEASARFTAFRQFSLLSGFYADADHEKAVYTAFLKNYQQSLKLDPNLFQSPDESVLNSAFSPESFTTPMRSLSQVIRQENISTIHLLKINVEKSEVDVLQGIEEDDWRKIQQMVLKVDTDNNLRRILSMLDAREYDVMVEQDSWLKDTSIQSVYAVRSESGRSLNRRMRGDSQSRTFPNLPAPGLSGKELRSWLSRRIPDFMVPSHVLFLPTLPLTQNGKIDYLALPPFEHAPSKMEDSIISADTPLPSLIEKIWGEVLGVGEVRSSDRFLEVGGDSILAIRFINRLDEQTGIRMGFSDIILQTFGEILNYCEKHRNKNQREEFLI